MEVILCVSIKTCYFQITVSSDDAKCHTMYIQRSCSFVKHEKKHTILYQYRDMNKVGTTTRRDGCAHDHRNK